jgi:hypothetical protein
LHIPRRDVSVQRQQATRFLENKKSVWEEEGKGMYEALIYEGNKEVRVAVSSPPAAKKLADSKACFRVAVFESGRLVARYTKVEGEWKRDKFDRRRWPRHELPD